MERHRFTLGNLARPVVVTSANRQPSRCWISLDVRRLVVRAEDRSDRYPHDPDLIREADPALPFLPHYALEKADDPKRIASELSEQNLTPAHKYNAMFTVIFCFACDCWIVVILRAGPHLRHGYGFRICLTGTSRSPPNA